MATIYGIPVADIWIASFAVSDWAIYPNSTTGGSPTTGSCDHWYYSSSYPGLFCGGFYSCSEDFGLFFVSYYGVSETHSIVGFRVIVLP